MAFVNEVVLQIDGRTEEQLDLEMELEEAVSPSVAVVWNECALVTSGRTGVRQSGPEQGKPHTKMHRCFYCKKEKRHNNSKRSHPTSYHCRAHPEYHVCNVKERPCFQEHLDHMACGH